MSIKRTLKTFAANSKGNVAIMTAITLPIAIGFAGLGAETGLWWYKERQLQASVDLASYAGAVVARAGGSTTERSAAAIQEATYHGYDSSIATITVNSPPTSGSNLNSRSVEVIVDAQYPRLLSSLFVTDPLNIVVRAVSTYDQPNNACVIALDETVSEALTFSGSASAQFDGCDLMANSVAEDAVSIEGSADVTAPCVNATGAVDVTASLTLTDCPEPRRDLPRAADPFETTPAPSTSGGCTSTPGGSGPHTLSAGKYCGGLNLSGDYTLNPGVYVISGGTLRINSNANVSGSGVTFYLTNNADVRFNGTADIDLAAPTSGTYEGLLFFADPTSSGTSATFNGTADSRLQGGLYFPDQHVEFLGDFSASNGCTRIVARTIEIRGNPNFSSNCTGTGLSGMAVPGAVRLVE